MDRHALLELIDFHEGRRDFPMLDDDGMATVLRNARRIALIGASPNPARPSNDVFRYLLAVGYEVVPINPDESVIEGRICYPSLAAAVTAEGPVDIVDVFRRAELCVPHAREAVVAGAKCLWLQLGVVNWEAARIAVDGGLSVVMDRCTAIELKRLAPNHPDMSR